MDIGRVDQLRQHLQDNPRQHNQNTFSCGTVACAAGWAVALEHEAQACVNLSNVVYGLAAQQATPSPRSQWDFRFCDPEEDEDDDWVDSTARYARMLLDLSADEARAIFYGTLYVNNPEGDTVALLAALVNREKGELTEADITILIRYRLPTEVDNEEVE